MDKETMSATLQPLVWYPQQQRSAQPNADGAASFRQTQKAETQEDALQPLGAPRAALARSGPAYTAWIRRGHSGCGAVALEIPPPQTVAPSSAWPGRGGRWGSGRGKRNDAVPGGSRMARVFTIKLTVSTSLPMTTERPNVCRWEVMARPRKSMREGRCTRGAAGQVRFSLERSRGKQRRQHGRSGGPRRAREGREEGPRKRKPGCTYHKVHVKVGVADVDGAADACQAELSNVRGKALHVWCHGIYAASRSETMRGRAPTASLVGGGGKDARLE
jgi:hypothetical protein